MKKGHIITYIITGILGAFVFFLILYIFGGRVNFDTNNQSGIKENFASAQSTILIDEKNSELTNDEKEGVNLYNNAIKSVVNITTVALRYSIFYDIVPSEGLGSGSIISEDGHILTNFHVISEVYRSKGGSITVTLYDQSKYDAQIVGIDPSTDLAVLKIKTDKKLVPIKIAKSTNIMVGQRVYAIGNPFGLSGTLTQGIISSLGRSIQAQDGTLIEDVIQTDAAINPGNSGGPLLDSKGRMIGINTSIFTQSNGNIGIGFAVSSNTLIKVVQDIIKFGLVKRPDLGIEDYYLLSQLPSVVREYFKFPSKGVVIIDIAPDSPAAKAGLKGATKVERIRVGWNKYEIPIGGDIIIGVDGKDIDTYNDIKSIIKYKNFGDKVELKIVRNGKTEKVNVELFEQ